MAENGYAKPVLVTTAWLAEHLGDEGIVVAEVDENPDLYDEGHIPGAVKLHWREDLQDPIERDVVDRETFERLLGGRGIGNDTAIILYGDKNNWFAAYAFWYVKVYGHSDVRILDGGSGSTRAVSSPPTFPPLRRRPTARRSGTSPSGPTATKCTDGSASRRGHSSTSALRASTRAT
jgi:thiosulfate/3-mercaptopyruvate sulfurtransferase